MMNFIEKPNLPEGKVKAIICGTDDKDILSFFKKEGIRVFFNSPNRDIDPSVSNHADMAAIHIGKDKIILSRNQINLKNSLEETGMNVYEAENEISGSYPDDIGLNFTFIGKYLVGKNGQADPKLTSLTDGCEKVNVNQGYSKCSTLVVNENAAITDDESIFKKLRENGIDCLLISKGDISLKGHNYGFIGGASGKISENTVVFFGDVKSHRDADKIIAFLNSKDCNFICTDSGKLRDIGGIIPIVEEV